jgi:PAS domain S-box-containing protein
VHTTTHEGAASRSELPTILLHIVDHISAMLAYWDRDQVCVFANEAYQDWFGKSRSELIGTTLQELLGPLYPLNLPYFLAALAGQTQVFERDIPLPSGETRSSIATYTPDLVDGVVRGVFVHVADVTSVKQLERELREVKAREARRESEARLAGIVNATLDAIISVDVEQRVVVFNPAAEQLFGCSADDALGRPLGRFLPTPLRLADIPSTIAIKEADATSNPTGTLRYVMGRRADGALIPLEASITQSAVNGELICTTILRDISARLESERAQRAAHDDLERRVAERTEALEAVNARLAEQVEARAASEARYRALLQNLPDVSVLMFDHDLHYLLAEGRAMRRHGYDPASIIGRSIWQVVPASRVATLAHNYRAALAGEATMMVQTLDAYTYETRFVPVRDDDGRIIAGMAVTEDTSERRRLEQSLREREQIFTTLFQILPIGVSITDPAGQILEANPACERMLGISQVEHQRRRSDGPVWQIVRLDGSPMPPAEYASVRALHEQRTVADVAMGVITPSGHKSWLTVTATPMPLPGYGVVIVYNDITERTEVEQMLRATLAERETLLKEIHHRVKNNLQVVVSLLRLQARNVTDPAAGGALRESRQRVEVMALVHDLLYRTDDLATIDADTYVRQLSNQLARIYTFSPGRVTVYGRAPGVQLSIDQAVPCGLIINELLSNSLKYAFPDGRAGTVGIELAEADDLLTMRVWDTGVGITPQPQGGRTSLGLQLVHDLVRQLRGTIDIASAAGTVVTIVFPSGSPLIHRSPTTFSGRPTL